MFNKIMIFLLCALIFILFISCSILGQRNEWEDDRSNIDENESEGEDMQVPEDNQQISDPIEEKIKEMTIDEKIGQMLMLGFEGYSINDDIKELIQNHHIGGLIVFERNIKDSDQLLSLINSLKQINTSSLPLILSVDEEGGRVTRMPSEFVKIPSKQTIGNINSEDLAFKIGSIIGERIGSFGFNMALTPVLDINSNPNNPVIADRAYGTQPELVARLAIQEMKGIKEQCVIPVVKHFPGHGDTSVDSHIGLPILNHPLQRLKDFELVPFDEAIKNGADVVMVAHILIADIDADNPSSLSKAVITDLLRHHMNFDGVVISDDLTMGAITENMDLGQAAIKAVNAGSDIILVCHGYHDQIAIIKALKTAVEQGDISRQRIDQSVYRIISLKQKYKLNDNFIQSIDVEKINNETNKILNEYIK